MIQSLTSPNTLTNAGLEAGRRHSPPASPGGRCRAPGSASCSAARAGPTASSLPMPRRSANPRRPRRLDGRRPDRDAVAAHRHPPPSPPSARRSARHPIGSGTAKPTRPYFGILGAADALVVTCDSVNMLGEAAFTGKPLYAWRLEGGSAKFDAFHPRPSATARCAGSMAGSPTGPIRRSTPTPSSPTRCAAPTPRGGAADPRQPPSRANRISTASTRRSPSG